MTNPSPEPIVELVGGTVPSDELLLWLCDWALDLVEEQEAEKPNA